MRVVIDPYDPAHVDWGPYLDVCGVVHLSWRRAPAGHWYRFCADIGPEVSLRSNILRDETPVTCLWCLSVERTL